MTDKRSGLQLRSTVKRKGELELSLARIDFPAPEPEEVVVRVEASPINPSDLGLLFALADMSTAKVSGAGEETVVTASIPQKSMKNLAGRLDQALPVGNEGAGTVVDAGSADASQALLGKTVALLGGAMYSQFRVIKAAQCLVLPDGTAPAAGASCFVNPLTALGMVESMRREGHTALVHTAAASNLGQMLNRICIADSVGLVNIVRRDEQVELLKSQGATWVCNSSSESFKEDLTAALETTGATIGFDAIGGGRLAGQILAAMEAAAMRSETTYSRYGSTTPKQVYIYGGLDRGPTELLRNFGMAWGLGGWLLPHFLETIGFEAAEALRQRVVAELGTTFKSEYSRVISLEEMLTLEAMAIYGKQATGEKFLVDPSKGHGDET